MQIEVHGVIHAVKEPRGIGLIVRLDTGGAPLDLGMTAETADMLIGRLAMLRAAATAPYPVDPVPVAYSMAKADLALPDAVLLLLETPEGAQMYFRLDPAQANALGAQISEQSYRTAGGHA